MPFFTWARQAPTVAMLFLFLFCFFLMKDTLINIYLCSIPSLERPDGALPYSKLLLPLLLQLSAPILPSLGSLSSSGLCSCSLYTESSLHIPPFHWPTSSAFVGFSIERACLLPSLSQCRCLPLAPWDHTTVTRSVLYSQPVRQYIREDSDSALFEALSPVSNAG